MTRALSAPRQFNEERFSSILKWFLFGLGIYALISRLWACEDAYITFRYIDNWINGHGLVYNVGDRVEGFTHPLWLFLIAIPAFLGVDIRAAALVLSLIFALAALAVLIWQDRDSNGRSLWLPLAPLLLLMHSGFRDFCVSGLEFPLVAFLIAWFFVSYKRHDLLGKPIFHGALLALMYLTRPELALLIPPLIAVYGGIAIREAIRGKRGEIRALILLLLPTVVIAGGYHLFRWTYYGEIFPNTYFAKQGMGAYWNQGIVYFLHFGRHSLVAMYALGGSLIAMLVNTRLRAHYFQRRQNWVMLLLAAILTIYVVRLGGDFMAYRFLLPPFMIVLIWFNGFLNEVSLQRAVRLALAVVAALAAVALVLRPLMPPKQTGYIADERQYYDLYHPPHKALSEDPVAHKWYQMGLRLKEYQERTNYPMLVAAGNIGYLGYAAGPKVSLLDVYGLVDRETARATHLIGQRGRPGHEFRFSMEIALNRRTTISRTPFALYDQVMGTEFGSIITFDPAFLKHELERVQRLKELKARLQAGGQDDGSLQFILELERRYGVQLEDI